MNKRIKVLLISLCVVSVSVIGSGIAGGAQRLLRGGWSWPTHIDPAVGSDISSSTALVSLYDALVYPDLKGNVQPHVAKSWEASADGLTWTFHLQKGPFCLEKELPVLRHRINILWFFI